jgi:ABC-2 type transport system ATP-binding protein
MAYVPGDLVLWPNPTGGEIIDLLGRLHGGLNQHRHAAAKDTERNPLSIPSEE